MKDEIYESLVSFIVNELQENSQFDELIKWYVCQYGGLRRHLLILLISLSGILLSSVLWMIARKKMQQTS